MSKIDVKIFVSQRIDQNSKMIINNPAFVNVRCGAMYDKRLPEEYNGIQGDDTGDNVSSMRRILNEFTVMYWAWKNSDADYMGLCHYRRFLNFTSKLYGKEHQDANGEVIIDSMADVNLSACGLLDENNIYSCIQDYDIIVNRSYDITKVINDTCRCAKEAWEKRSPQYLKKAEFDILLGAIKEYSPEYYNDAKEYMRGKKFRGFNCFVMKKEYFNELCEFVFPILFYLTEKFEVENKSMTQNRAPAYAGEWLYSIWVYHMQKKKSLKIKECQLFVFQNTEPVDTLCTIEEKSIPIVFTGRGVGRLDISVAIQSILVHRTNDNIPIDIIILQQSNSLNRWENHIREEENKKLCKQVEAFENASIRFFDPKDYIGQFECYKYNGVGNEEACYKLMLPWILEKYSRVIYFENNNYINSDILNFWNVDLENASLAAPRDFFAIGNFNGYDSINLQGFTSNIEDKEILMNYFSTDLFIMDLEKVRQEYSSDQLYNEYLKISKNNIFSNSKNLSIIETEISDTFNWLFHNKVKFLPYNYSKTLATTPEYYRFLEFVPEELMLESDDVTYAYSLRSIYTPICYRNLSISSAIMEIMKSTPFYEAFVQESTMSASLADVIILKDKFMRCFMKLVPYNSLRWKMLKKILK